ncbi:hypothetical protein CORC01_10126 [Colletotrichum orchidophilum]|uniref:Secreted protein n=1 Tax=Colletotrichum orchidophilum TaxID=1209926 RepID=A0A1G4AZJ2_9PEZI|nr:uncharacterized protein CORC01_10126 [Colletotrichum orchidophilum]OHE94598.1 hypothetical protein CORC01_10126 [Colletotrichum orchidophilum]
MVIVCLYVETSLLLAALAEAHRSLGAQTRSRETSSSGNWPKGKKNKTWTGINKQTIQKELGREKRKTNTCIHHERLAG